MKYKREVAVFPSNDLHKQFNKMSRDLEIPKSKIMVTLVAMFVNGEIREDYFIETLKSVSSKFQKPGRKSV